MPLIFSLTSCYVKNINKPAAIPNGQATNQYLSTQSHKQLTVSKFLNFLSHLYSKVTIGLHRDALLTDMMLYYFSYKLLLQCKFNCIPQFSPPWQAYVLVYIICIMPLKSSSILIMSPTLLKISSITVILTIHLKIGCIIG